ncbi:MAG: apolipoprotein N-acyltransferase [Bacteroidetes bacterium]|nr:apolipoprotein N-acyltransferase [Bacteroidota bacterium]HET6245732.1 apolipoprotein N-acyltransferase [Bacteroidia bacterium]
MKKFKLLFLSLLSGVLLSVAWPATGGLFFLVFLALVPLLYVENIISNNRDKYKSFHFFNYAYVTFFTWNAITTWWIYYATAEGMVAAVICNALFMAVIALLFHFTRKVLGEKRGYIALVVYWISFEYLHLEWDLSWPWLTIGNVFAQNTELVQWYEYTGIMGGTLWVLVVNILLFRIFRQLYILKTGLKNNFVEISTAAFILFAPILFSIFTYANYKEKSDPLDIVVVQPNIDPYFEKFNGLTPEQQLEKMNTLAASMIDQNTDYVVFPETALPQGIWENKLENAPPVKAIKEFIKDFPKLHYVTGLSSFREYLPGDKLSATARPYRDGGGHYDLYNTAMQIDHDPEIQIYHKSKLVPGVEKMPFPSLFGFLEAYAIDIGGMTGSHGTDAERGVFSSIDGKKRIAPVICYESIYGEYIGEYIKNGAEVIFIITNDGWWQDTPGYKQHLQYAKLKAVSNRRSIARSANTGVSCFINQRGDIQQATSWWEPAVIRQTINANDKITFYAQHGDYIARAAVFIAALIFLSAIAFSMNKTKQRLG